MELKSLFKLSALSLLIAPVSMAFAQDAYMPCSFCGVTLGVGVGATTFMSNTDSISTVTDPSLFSLLIAPGLVQPPIDLTANNFSSSADARVYRYNAMASLFAGYGLVYENHAYLGAELGVNFMGANNINIDHETVATNTATVLFPGGDPSVEVDEAQAKVLDVTTKVTRNSVEPFLDIKLGMLVTPTAMVYLRGGINYNTVKIKQTTNYSGTDSLSTILDGIPTNSTVGTTAFADSHSESKSAIGWRAGVGMEIMVTPEFGIGADYIYSFYPRVSSSGEHDIAQNICDTIFGCFTFPGVHSSSIKANVDDQQLQAQFIYHFGML